MKIPFFSENGGLFSHRSRTNPPRLKVDVVRMRDGGNFEYDSNSIHDDGYKTKRKDDRDKDICSAKDKKIDLSHLSNNPKENEINHVSMGYANGRDGLEARSAPVRKSGLNQKMKKLTSTLPHLFSLHHNSSSANNYCKGEKFSSPNLSKCQAQSSSAMPTESSYATLSMRDTHSNGMKANYQTLASNKSALYQIESNVMTGGSLGRMKKSTTPNAKYGLMESRPAQQSKEAQLLSLKGIRPVSDLDSGNAIYQRDNSSIRLLNIERRGSGIETNTMTQAGAGIGWIDSDTSTSSSRGVKDKVPRDQGHAIRDYNGDHDVKMIYRYERPNVAIIKSLPELTPLPVARALESKISIIVPSMTNEKNDAKTALKREDTLVYRLPADSKRVKDYDTSSEYLQRYHGQLSSNYNNDSSHSIAQSIYGTIKTGRSYATSTTTPVNSANQFSISSINSATSITSLPLYVNPNYDGKPLLFVPLSQNGQISKEFNTSVKLVVDRFNKTDQLFDGCKPNTVPKGTFARYIMDDEDPGIMSEMETSSTRYYNKGPSLLNITKSSNKDDNVIIKNSHPSSIGSYHTLRMNNNKITSSDQYTISNQNNIGKPTYGSGNVIFLRFGQETKRISLPPKNIKNILDVHILFQKTFKQLTLNKLEKFFKIYIQDNDSPREIFYELEDVGEIMNRSVIKLVEAEEYFNRNNQSPLSNVERDACAETDSENYYALRYENDQSVINALDDRECDLSYFSEPEYNPNRRRGCKVYTSSNTNKFGIKNAAEFQSCRDPIKYSSQINNSEFSDAERPLAKQLVLRSNECLQSNYQQSPSKFTKQRQILDNMEARLYHDSSYRNHSQSLSSKTESVPWDLPDTKMKMDTMEKKLKVLTSMVQKALVKSPSPYHTEDVADYKDHSLLSKSASLLTLSGLKSLQRKSLEIKLDIKALRDLTKIYVFDLNNLLLQTKNKILQICKYVPSSNLCKLSTSLRYSIDEFDNFYEENLEKEGIEGVKKEIRIYHQDMSKLEKVLNDLEISVEECRNDIVNNKSQVQVADIESMALALSYASRAVSDLKNRYPSLEKILINEGTNISNYIDEEDREAFTKERQIFLKIEPEKLENSLKRCKKLTATLYTLKKMTTSGAFYGNPSHPMLTGPSRSPSNQSLISMRSSNLGNKNPVQNANLIKLSLQSSDSTQSSLKIQPLMDQLLGQRSSMNTKGTHSSQYNKFSTLPLLTLPYTAEAEECDIPVNTRGDFNRNSAISSHGNHYSSVKSNGSLGGGSCYSGGASANGSSLSSFSARSSPVFGLGRYPMTVGPHQSRLKLEPSHHSESEDGTIRGHPLPLNYRTRIGFKNGDKFKNASIGLPNDRDNGLMETISKQLEDSISHLYEMGEFANVKENNYLQLHSSSPLPYNLKDITGKSSYNQTKNYKDNLNSNNRINAYQNQCTNNFDNV